MTRKRDYKAEYARRKARGLAKGLSLSQARGHPRPSEKYIRSPEPDPQHEVALDKALTRFLKRPNLKQAVAGQNVSIERFRRYLHDQDVANWTGKTWIVSAVPAATVKVLSGGKVRKVKTRNRVHISLAGQHENAVGQALRTRNWSVLDRFVGKGVLDTSGRLWPFETVPNTLLQLMRQKQPRFDEIYRPLQAGGA